MAKNQAFRGIKLLYIFLTVTPTDSACFAWGVDLTQRLAFLVGFFSGLLIMIYKHHFISNHRIVGHNMISPLFSEQQQSPVKSYYKQKQTIFYELIPKTDFFLKECIFICQFQLYVIISWRRNILSKKCKTLKKWFCVCYGFPAVSKDGDFLRRKHNISSQFFFNSFLIRMMKNSKQ